MMQMIHVERSTDYDTIATKIEAKHAQEDTKQCTRGARQLWHVLRRVGHKAFACGFLANMLFGEHKLCGKVCEVCGHQHEGCQHP